MNRTVLAIGIIFLLIGASGVSSTDNISKDVSFVCKFNNPPYEPSDPIPPSGSTNVSIHIVLRWTGGDPDGDEVIYDVYFGNSSPPPKIADNISSNFWLLTTLDFNTFYYWKVVSTDEYGASTPGPIWIFTTRGNSPPMRPILVDYDNKTLYFYSIDPDGDDIRYHIDWGDGITESTEWYPSGEIVGLSHSWLDGVYFMRIKAEDIYGAEGPWLEFEIRIGNQAPYPPMIYGPVSGNVGEEYTFSFNAVDYEGDNVSFFVEWGDGTSDGWSFYVESGEDLEYQHTWFEQDDYFIRCKASDSYKK